MTHPAAAPAGAASLTVRAHGNTVALCFAGRLDVPAAAALWPATLHAAGDPSRELVLDLSAVQACDTAGTSLCGRWPVAIILRVAQASAVSGLHSAPPCLASPRPASPRPPV